jgi:hypothetical protein
VEHAANAAIHTGTSACHTSAEQPAWTPDLRKTLVGATKTGAAKLITFSGLSPVLLDSLIVMSAESLQRAELAQAAQAVRQGTMPWSATASTAGGLRLLRGPPPGPFARARHAHGSRTMALPLPLIACASASAALVSG